MRYDFDAIIERIINLKSDELNEWESDFMNSVYTQDYELTENQKNKILQIHRKYIVNRR